MSHSFYEPLDPNGGIRLLILEPGQDDSHISCRLISHNINLNPDYKALSYEWGSQSIQSSISLDSQSFQVGENLWWALWYLRKDGAVTRLWVDALCINQQDEKERGHQVSMMGRIYRNADVICWLGKGEDPKHIRAMEHICDWIFIESRAKAGDRSTHPESSTTKKRHNSIQGDDQMLDSFASSASDDLAAMVDPPAKMQPRTVLKSGVTSMLQDEHAYSRSPSHFVEVEAICSHSYWRRTWIIQEFVLGKSIRIRLGSYEIGESDFQLAVEQVLLQRFNSKGLQLLDSFRVAYLRSDRLNGHQLPLIRLIELSEKSSCQDLRDRIYAMIGLASDCQNGEIIPDYSKSFCEVFEDVVLRHFYPSDLDRLGHSWSTVYASCLVQRILWRTSESVSEVDEAILAQKLLDTDLLSIHGKSCGTVRELSVPQDGMWWAHAGLVKPIRSSSASDEEVYTKLDLINQQGVEGNDVESRSFLTFTWPWIVWALKSKKREEEESQPERTIIMRAEIGESFQCYVPGCTQIGDKICRFVNSSTVAVLRLSGKSTTLIGRGMILDRLGDLDILLEGETGSSENFTDTMFSRNNPVLSFKLTPAELKSLTSPHY